jgi:hypothetical protein
MAVIRETPSRAARRRPLVLILGLGLVRQLQEVEARHPDTAADLDPIIRALSSPEESMIGTEQARKLLGVRSVNTVKRWIEVGILAGTWDERSGRWRIPLAEVLRLRGTQQALAEVGGEDLTAEELDGRWPLHSH